MPEKTAAELAAENDELRERVATMEKAEVVRVRERAAEKVGLDPVRAAKFIQGETPEEIDADARKLAALAGTTPAPHSGSEQTAARAIAKQEEADRRELAMALSGNGEPTPEGEGRE